MATPQTVTLDQVLDLAELLPPEQRVTLAEILKKRSLETRRAELIESVSEARTLHAKGELETMSIEDLLKKLNQ